MTPSGKKRSDSLPASASAWIDLDEVDRALAVDAARFVVVAMELEQRLRRQGIGVDVQGYRERRLVASRASEMPFLLDGAGSVYQMELRRIPPMDRDEEQRMARRHEFFRLRVERELARLRRPVARAPELLGRTADEIAQCLAIPAAEAPALGWLVHACTQWAALRQLYVESALHLVLGIVGRYAGFGIEVPDLVQEGNASLFRAIDGFEWRRELRFRTYAQYWVQQAVLKMIYNTARTVRMPIWVQKLLGQIRRIEDECQRAGRAATPAEIALRLGISERRVRHALSRKRRTVSLEAATLGEETIAHRLVDEAQPPVPDLVPEGDLAAVLQQALAGLPDRNRWILQRRFGLDGAPAATLGEIAIELGITSERVRQLQNQALERILRVDHRLGLRRFLAVE